MPGDRTWPWPRRASLRQPRPQRAERVPELTADQKRVRELAVANCESMWDRGTHMTKRDWARTCRRVQNRLQSLDVK